MFINLGSQLLNRFIEELREFWKDHPRYPDLPQNIQDKFSWETRPQEGMIVKVGGSSAQRLDAGDFIGYVYGHAMMYRIPNAPGEFLEWVKDDSRAIYDNQGMFPSAPGIYFLDIISTPSVDADTGLTVNGTFYVDRLFDIRNEAAIRLNAQTFQVTQLPIHPKSIRLYLSPNGTEVYEDSDFSVNYETGEITFAYSLPTPTQVLADYRLIGDTTGPHGYRYNFANNLAIPGVILGFGHKVKVGDKLAIIIQDPPNLTNLEYGLRWSTSIDIDIMSRDVFSQREIAERSAMFLNIALRKRFANEGIEILEVSIGGESENIYDENGDDYFFNSSLSLTVETEAFIWEPVTLFLKNVSSISIQQAKMMGSMTEEELSNLETNYRVATEFGLKSWDDPYFQITRR